MWRGCRCRSPLALQRVPQCAIAALTSLHSFLTHCVAGATRVPILATQWSAPGTRVTRRANVSRGPALPGRRNRMARAAMMARPAPLATRASTAFAAASPQRPQRPPPAQQRWTFASTSTARRRTTATRRPCVKLGHASPAPPFRMAHHVRAWTPTRPHGVWASSCHRRVVATPSSDTLLTPVYAGDDGNEQTEDDQCITGVCRGSDVCGGVNCAASDQCHDAGICNLGVCTDPVKRDGSPCDDGDDATVRDR